MDNCLAKGRARSLRSCAAAAVIVLSGSALADATTPAVSSSESGRVAQLELAYWRCDYVATTRGIPGPDACFAVADELMRTKFGGDFKAMLAWWQQNKSQQHRQVRTAYDN